MPFRRIALSILFIVTVIAVDAQRWDNYKPDNRYVVLDSTNMPIVFIDTNGQMIDRDNRITARMKIIWNGDGMTNFKDTVSHPDQNKDYDGYISLKYRGNSSFTLSDKKPYSIKLIDESGGKVKEKLLGMGKDNDWAMLAPYSDRSMIRDVLAFTLAKPYSEFIPSARHCELILDGTYYGVYVLTERVTKGKRRLNLDDPGTDGDEITGGYLVQVDRDDEDHVYRSKHHPMGPWGELSWNYIVYQYKHPEYDEMNYNQRKYLTGRIDAMEDALAASNYKDPEQGYRKYLSAISFIDHQLSTEFSHNVDGYRLSTNMYKHRDSVDPLWKLTLWDINLGYGNSDYYDGSATNTWVYEQNNIMAYQDNNLIPFWWGRLMNDESYVEELKARWTQYRNEFYSDEHLTHVLDSLYDVLTCKDAEKRNSRAWPRWNRYVWPNNYVSKSISDEFNYLRGWIADRAAYMDSKWLNPSGIIEVSASKHLPQVWPLAVRSGGEINISPDGPDVLTLLSTDGKQWAVVRTDGEVCHMSLAGIPAGIYILRSKTGCLKITVRQ